MTNEKINLVHKIRGSSNLSYLTYVETVTGHSVLRVGFKGSVSKVMYVYEGVERATFDKIITAPSAGREFIRLVKNQPDKYPYEKVDLQG